MEVGRIAGQNDDATGRIRRHLIAVEAITQADVENAGHDRVDSVLRMSVRHQLYARGHFDPDRVGAGLRGVTDNDGEPDRRWERRERLPVDLFGQDRSENGLAWLVGSHHWGPPRLVVLLGAHNRPWRMRQRFFDASSQNRFERLLPLGSSVFACADPMNEICAATRLAASGSEEPSTRVFFGHRWTLLGAHRADADQ